MNRDTTNQLILVAVMKRRLDEIEKALRASALEQGDPGEKRNAKAGDVTVGMVLVTDPQPSWRVTRRDQFAEWVQEHRPDEVETITAVRSSFEKAVLSIGGVLDPDTGEVVPVPGVEIQTAQSTLQVKPDWSVAEQAISNQLHAEGVTFGAALDQIEGRR